MWLDKHLEHRDIQKDGSLYMRRYYLFQSKWVSVFIHYILRGDDDRYLHDHPWSFIAILLTGSYVEEDLTGFHRIWPFMPRFRRATYLHRLHLHKPVWTVFIHFRRTRKWGFQTPTGWTYWRKYLGLDEGYMAPTVLPVQKAEKHS